ncbi:MAG: translation elongation factor Ts [Geodermatophilaceae bacterium]
MPSFTAADVKRLRDMTGSGMLACKNALAESDGDFDKAVELLRIKGAKDVGKRLERAAANGLVLIKDGAMLEVNCETDFVAKNEGFQGLAARLIDVVRATRPVDVPALLAESMPDGTTVAQTLQDESAKIGEKLELTRFVVFDGTTATYLHRKATDLPPAIGVLVEYEGGNEETARSVAMQVAASRPKFLTRDEVPPEIVESEKRIAEQTAREEGKPEQAMSRIIEGRVGAFFKDFVLLEQPSITDPKRDVAAVLSQAGVAVRRFARFEVGQP